MGAGSGGCAQSGQWKSRTIDVGTATVVFTSLLIGLITGVQPVRVEVEPADHVSSVRIELDGRVVGTAKAAPWEASVDFGADLRPHRISAVAFDPGGREIGRVTRNLNVSQSPVRADLLVECDQRGAPHAARLVSTSARGDQALRRSIRLDGERLSVDAQGRAFLPKLDLSKAHILSAVADYGRDALGRADLAIGGDMSAVAGRRLTAIPIRVDGPGTPTLESLEDAFETKAGRVKPVAVEKPESALMFVRHPLNTEASKRIGRPSTEYPLLLDKSESVGFIWPVAKTGAVSSELFEMVGPFGERDRGFHWLITHVARLGTPEPPPFRFADAVAVAGNHLSGTCARRVAVLIQGDERDDASQLSPQQVEAYLATIGVPLRVWSLLGIGRTKWSNSEDVSSFFKFTLAVDRLRSELDRQRLVWVEGDWIPGEITLTANAPPGVKLLN
jgi:hypothetical protein